MVHGRHVFDEAEQEGFALLVLTVSSVSLRSLPLVQRISHSYYHAGGKRWCTGMTV